MGHIYVEDQFLIEARDKKDRYKDVVLSDGKKLDIEQAYTLCDP